MADDRRPNTISDKDWAALQQRRAKSAPPMFSSEAVDKRQASEDQRKKSRWS